MQDLHLRLYGSDVFLGAIRARVLGGDPRCLLVWVSRVGIRHTSVSYSILGSIETVIAVHARDLNRKSKWFPVKNEVTLGRNSGVTCSSA